MSGARRSAVIACGFVALAPIAGAANLLQNPRFQSNLDGWTVTLLDSDSGGPSPTATWDPQGGFGGGGGAKLTGYQTDAFAGLSQCLPVTQGTIYRFQVWTSGDGFNDYAATPNIMFFSGSGCGGEWIPARPPAIPEFAGPNECPACPRWWAAAQVAPAGAKSVQVNLIQYGHNTMYCDQASLDPLVKGDFDNDDKADLVLRQPSGDYALWTMNGTTRTGQWTLGTWPPGLQTPDLFSSLVGVEELTGDERSDLVFQGALTGQIEIWPITTLAGNPFLAGVPLPLDAQPSSAWRVAAAGRFVEPSAQPYYAQRRGGLVLRNTTTNGLRVWI